MLCRDDTLCGGASYRAGLRPLRTSRTTEIAGQFGMP